MTVSLVGIVATVFVVTALAAAAAIGLYVAARGDRVPGPGELDNRDGLTSGRLVATILATLTAVT
jgi:hypothetical protein